MSELTLRFSVETISGARFLSLKVEDVGQEDGVFCFDPQRTKSFLKLAARVARALDKTVIVEANGGLEAHLKKMDELYLAETAAGGACE